MDALTCCLRGNFGRTDIPLQGISLGVILNHFVAQVEVTLGFFNDGTNPIEAVFSFFQEDITIFEFQAIIEEKILTAVCKEKESAFAIYDNAIASGNGAYLLEKDTKNVFKMNVGNLPPKKACIIKIKYATTIKTNVQERGNFLELVLPITAVPLSHNSFGTFSDKLPNGISLNVDISMPSEIVYIESMTHEIETTISGKTAKLNLKDSLFSSSFVCFSALIGLDEPHTPAIDLFSSPVSAENNSVSSTLMLSLFPRVDKCDEVVMEYIFLADRSGSMSGGSIERLKNALQLFLRSIPVGSMFNIIGFGSTVELLFANSVVYNQDNFTVATNYTAKLKADLGGTEILRPLQDILTSPPISIKNSSFSFPRQVIVLTDGDVTNPDGVIKMAQMKLGPESRIFTIGIGASAGIKLVKGLAKVGKGEAEFVLENATTIEAVVLTQLKRAMKSYLHVEIDWGSNNEIVQTPTQLPPVYPGDPIIVYGITSNDVKLTENVKLTIRNGSGNTRIVEVSLSSMSYSPDKTMIGVLAAASLIRETEKKLENHQITEALAKESILPLALRHSLVTKFTSLVAEEKRQEPTEGTMETKLIDTPILSPQNNASTFAPPSSSSSSSYGSTGMKLFGKSKKNTTPAQSIQRMRDTLELLEKREAFLENKIKSEAANAKNLMIQKNKKGALNSLKKKHAYEQQKEQLTGSNMAIQTQLMSLEGANVSAQTLEAMQIGSGVMRNIHAGLTVDNIDRTMADIEQAMSMHDIQQAISTPIANFDDDDELLAELEELEADEDLFGSSSPPQMPLSVQQIPSSVLSDEDDELRALEIAMGVDSTSSMVNSTTSKNSNTYYHNNNYSTPSYSAPHPAKNVHLRPLDSFILLQQAEGNWDYSEEFLQLAKISKEKIESIFGKLQGWWGKLVITALAIFILETIFRDNEVEWSMLRDKALLWLKRELVKNNSTETPEKIMEKVKLVM